MFTTAFVIKHLKLECLNFISSLHFFFNNKGIFSDFVFLGGIFNRSYLFADENHNHAKGIVLYFMFTCFI